MTTSTSFAQMANNQSISLSSALRANTPPTKGQTTSRKFLTLSIFFLLLSFFTTNLWGADTWTLVTNVNDLAVGDEVVIAASAADYALSTTQNGNNRGQAAITKSQDKSTIKTPSNSVQILTLKAGNTSGTWAFYTGSSGYLYAASSGSNHLKTQTTNNANGSWKITIAANGVATIKATGTNTRNWLRYNSSNNPPIFSCYGSGQGDVCIYKKVTPVVPQTIDVTLHYKGISTTINNQTSPYTLPTTGDYVENACDGWEFAGWYGSEYAKSETEPSYITQLTSTGAAYAVYSKTETTDGGGGETEVTKSVSISNYATAHNWNNDTKYSLVTIDENITATASTGTNTGKYYTSGTNWRFYQTEKATLTLSAATGCTIKTVKVTYSVSNTGVLTYKGTNVNSGTATTINATSATFGVGNTGSATNGQVRITAIEVIYTTTSAGGTITTTYYHSTPDCGTPTPTPLNAPSNLRETITCAGVSLAWDAVSGASKYEYTLNGTSTQIDKSSTSVYISPVTAGKIYTWTVKAIGDGMTYSDSPDAAVRTFTSYYSVTYNLNGGSWNPGCENSCVAGGENFEICSTEPSKDGYNFVGWSTADDTEAEYQAGGTINNVSANTTLYAVWEAIPTYTVTFDSDGGSAVTEQTIENGKTATKPNDPTKAGHTFIGWHNGDTEFDFSTQITGDIELKAKWTINQYKVTLNPNYPNDKTGTFTYKEGELVDGNLVFTYDYNTASKTIADLYTSLTLDGYEFGGWYNAKGANPGEVSGSKCTTTGTITGNKTYFAKWSKLYSITLSENGTTKELDAQTSTSYTLPTELIAGGSCQDDTKELVGWSTVAIPNPGDKPTSKFYELGETVTLTEDQTTFYAVFATAEGDGNGNYIKVTSEPTDWSGDYLIVANGNCFDGSRTTTIDAGGNYKSVTISNNEITSNTTTDSYSVSISKSTNNGKYYIKTKSGYYIGSTAASDNELLNSTTTKYDNTISISGNDVTIKGTNSIFRFYVQSGQTPRFRYYKGTTNTVLPQLYKKSSGTSYSDYTTTCVEVPDPILSFVTTPADPIVFDPVNCGSTTSKAQAKTVQVSGANLQEYVSVEVTGPYKIARTSSTNLSDYTTSLTLDKTTTGAIHSNYQTVYIISTPPAQSTEATTGTLTFTTTKGNTLTVNLSTPTVNCTTYALTFNDRGNKTVENYYAGASVSKPEDPTGVCTDPIHYVFDGWAEVTVANGSTEYTKVTFPYTMPGQNKTLYAVYRYLTSGGNGDYNLVTSVLDDWSGDYLIAYSDQIFANGKIGGKDGIGAAGEKVDLSSYITNNTIPAAEGDKYKVSLEAINGGYLLKTQDGQYNYQSSNTNGLETTTNKNTATNYKLSVNFVSFEEINLCLSGNAEGAIFQYNTDQQGYFRFYKNGGQQPVYLYKKADGTTYYTTSPVCGPMLEITSGKEIYVTGGYGTGRNTVIAQQTVEYRATRLKTQNGSAGGKAPDVKVAANGITIGGEVTDKVKVVELTQNKELIGDKYTITGTVTVQYTPKANNLQEEIQVQLAVDYNSEAKDNFTVYARSLPQEFVIVAKQGDKWYALNGDMSGHDAEKANGYLQVDDIGDPTKAIFAPCNTIYTFDGMVDGGNKEYVRFQGIDGKYLWAASEGNTGIQNYAKNTPTAGTIAYNWQLYTSDNETYQLQNEGNGRKLGLSKDLNFGMYSYVSTLQQDIRILPIEAKCIYNYAPTNLKVSVLKSTSVTLTWDAVAGATKYQYSTDGNTWTDAGTEPTVTINGLTEGKGYTYYIRAYHEDDATKECIDYSEITFTTADCDDVPADITYSADLTSITVTWTAVSTNCTVRLYSDEACEAEDQIKFADELKGSVTFSQLDRNTTYYVRVFAEGTCASPIVPVKTEDVELDIVEWDKDKIYVDINTNEKVSVTLENEVSYGSGSGKKADELFFSKYFEGSGSLKMIAIYNGTGKDVNLSEYRIDRGGNGDATNISKTYDLSQLGVIKQGQEIIFYSWPLTSEDSYSCSQSFLESKAQESGLDANPRWILCDAKTHSGIEFEAMDFSGDDPLLFYKGNTLIDVFGVSTAAERPSSKEICSGRYDNCWSATGVSNMDYGKTTEDFPNGEIPYGVNVDDETITAYTARVIMFRKNTVVSGKNAVTKNNTTFATFADEWEARQVCRSGDDGNLTCAAYQELGTFDYSKYYTKFESMGDDLVFDTNSRNSDGTITVPISGLNKQSCRNIKITVKDAAGNVLKSQDYKVPIMITTDQETAYTDENKNQNAFYALQENLATVEVDGNGNPTGNKTNLTLEQVREICKTCDVVVRDNATLTKVTDGTTNDHPQVRNVYVYEGASIVIPDGDNHNYTINGLSLRRKGDVVASAQVQGTGKFVLPADEPVCLDLRVDANNWHWFTLPFDCLIEDVTWVDGTPAKYNTDWFLMYYDGESRAASTNPYDNHWKVYDGTTIKAGKGYIVGITGDLTHPNYTFELRFPMAQDVLTAEQTRKTVPVNAWGVKSDNKPNNLGWNLVGNPYLNYYKTAVEYSPLAGLPLIKYTSSDLVVGEFYEEENGNIPFLVTPIDGGWYEYRQELASEVNMMPFTAYFVQVGDPKTHTNGEALNASFEASNRGKKSIVRRAPREVEEIEEPIIVRVELTNSKGESDKTSLVIDDRFTNEYEMNGDFFKWFGDYYNYYTKPVLYTIGADQGKRAFNALNEELAKQPIPMGMYAAQAGNYTFSLNQQFDLSRVEEVWLYDATQSTYTNLMQSDYTFSTSKVNGAGRFSLSVKLAPKVATNIDNVTADKVWATTHTKQVIVNGLENGMHLWLYDATGKLLYNEPTSNYQHTYVVPQTGTYFVSVMNGNQKQTIKVVVE